MLHTSPFILLPPLLAPVSIVCAAVVLLIASLNDIASRTLPNWACLAVAAIGIALRTADTTLLASLGVAGLIFLAAFLCWRRGWLGGGDVKLLAACTLLVPPGKVIDLILATAIAGGVLSVIYLLLRRFGPSHNGSVTSPNRHRGGLVPRVWRVECWRIRRRGSLPYGCAIAAAALIMLFIPSFSSSG